MPFMDGTETLRLIQEVAPEIEVIVVSGYATEGHARTLLKHGAWDFFQNPVELSPLRESVERLQSLKGLG